MVRRNAGGPGVTHGLDTSFLVATEVGCHADRTAARALASSLRQKGDQFALAPQALAEFCACRHRCETIHGASDCAASHGTREVWWNASDVERVWPDEVAAGWFFAAMARHQLGRKRVLDTLLAGTFHSANITSVLTLNAADFAVFCEFTCVPLAAAPAAQT